MASTKYSDYGYAPKLPRIGDQQRNFDSDFQSTKTSSFGHQNTSRDAEPSEEETIKQIKRKIAANQSLRALAESEL